MRERKKKDNYLILMIDLVGIILAFYLAWVVRHGFAMPNLIPTVYGDTLFILILSYIVIFESDGSHSNIFKRGFFEEFVGVVKGQVKLFLILLCYLIFTQGGNQHSRIFLLVFFALSSLVIYVARSYLKLIMLVSYKRSSSSRKVMLITLARKAEDILLNIRKEYFWEIQIPFVAIMDEDMVGSKILDIPVIANQEGLLERAKLLVVDEVFIHLPDDYNMDIHEIITEFEKMGVIVHLNVNIYRNLKIRAKRVDSFGKYQIITFQSNMFGIRQVFLKRMLDIVGGLIGLLVTAVLTVFLAPAILLESKGPVFFSQIRVGKNGRPFKIYKFRSMYQDAEERKKELMAQNEMKGNMFKITNDPRVTKVGRFLRKTSLDEFPQFWNVFKGEMSLVGSRPPTMDEFQKYEYRHKRRLSVKPGLTGLWQVSGRSDIGDFEDVVRLDLEYIDNWSMLLDVKLILKTMVVVMFGKGAR